MATVNQQTISVNVPTVATSTTALASNPGRTAWAIQNQGTATLKVCMGTPASDSVYHIILKASSMAADGTGGFVSEESGTVYTGPIYVYSASTPSYTVIEHGGV